MEETPPQPAEEKVESITVSEKDKKMFKIILLILFWPITLTWWIWHRPVTPKWVQIAVTVFCGLAVLTGIGIANGGSGSTTPSTKVAVASTTTSTPTATATLSPTATPKPTPTPAPTPTKTPQQLLEDQLTSDSNKTIGGTDFSYKELQVEQDTPDRPKGSTLLTINVNVKSFLDKDSLTRDTGQLSSNLLQTTYKAAAMNPFDVDIWYYGDTKDQYGNTKSSVIMTYAIDKSTFSKINWSGFDQTGFCSFLKGQSNSSDSSDNDNCVTLANIQ